MMTFSIGDKSYETDEETLTVIGHVSRAARLANDYSALLAMMILGQKTGRIVEIERWYDTCPSE